MSYDISQLTSAPKLFVTARIQESSNIDCVSMREGRGERQGAPLHITHAHSSECTSPILHRLTLNILFLDRQRNCYCRIANNYFMRHI